MVKFGIANVDLFFHRKQRRKRKKEDKGWEFVAVLVVASFESVDISGCE